METFILENDNMKLTMRSKSAEMISLIKKDTGAEYLWNGDSRYWGWSSPVLFPFVGMLRDKKYTYQGKSYELGQHGFARNQEFAMISKEDEEIWFALLATEETKAKYPFDFKLEVGYALCENTVKVMWRVKNTGGEKMYFSIGAHPAFMCPLNEEGKQTDYYMGFETDAKEMKYRLIDASCSLIDPKEYSLPLEDGLHQIESDRFDLDALIIEGKQTGKMWLAKPDKTPYVTVEFDAPLFGVWSPAKKEAPFVCIEPWYGRSDRNDFNGTLEEREYMTELAPGEDWERSYTVTLS